jgi:hypothetical protein
MSTEPLFQEPTVCFRAIKRKGALRYIASLKRGSLNAMTRFAPPTKKIPKLIFMFAGWIDFRFSVKFNWIIPLAISEDFLSQVANLLKASPEDIGLYVGEPTAQQKLIITDVTGKSDFVLKLARGAEADESIRRETMGIKNAISDDSWSLGIPSIRNIDPIFGREAILVERVKGSQLTQNEFEKLFFDDEDILHQTNAECDKSTTTIEQWLESTSISKSKSLAPIIDKCRTIGALDISSSLGIVHGDFAPWNVITKKESRNLGLETKAPRLTKSLLIAIDWEFSSQDKPVIFDIAYAAWCYETLLGRQAMKIETIKWEQLVSLGALWEKMRNELCTQC